MGSVAMFQKLSGMTSEFMETVKQFKEQATRLAPVQRMVREILYICLSQIPESDLSILLHQRERVRLFRRRRMMSIWNWTLYAHNVPW